MTTDPRYPAPGFPDPRLAGPDGLVLVGGELTAETVLAALRQGIFPWPVRHRGREFLAWWSPDPRAILELSSLHVGRTMARLLRQDRFAVSVDRAFDDVVAACARTGGDWEMVWITPELAAVYGDLHRRGHAHSLEVWDGPTGALVGGIFGIAVGGLFAGESMFSAAPNGSKVAFIRLAQRLREAGFRLFDVQLPTPHLQSLGVTTIDRGEYLDRLAGALRRSPDFGPGSPPGG